MTQHIRAIAAILLSVLVFLVGNGLMGTLIPVRGDLAGFGNLAIGAIGSAYYAGFVLGCLSAPSLLVRVGHIRTFAVSAAVAAVTVLLQAMVVNAFAWGAARLLFGLAAAGIYTVIESWLNDRASNETRGRILSAYLTVNFGGLVVGQWLYTLAPPTSFILFNLSAIFYALCLLPVGLTRLPQPQAIVVPELRPMLLFRIAPVGAVGCIVVGLVNGAIWALAPVYAHDHGLRNVLLATFMSVFTAAGALMQVPVGRISDLVDRRYVIAVMSLLGAASGLVLALFGGRDSLLTILLFGFYGAATLPIYGLSVAHTNDRIPRENFVATSATLLLLNALASVVGPLVVALISTWTSLTALFVFAAISHLAHSGFTLWRIRIVRAPSNEHREPYAPISPEASPAALELDPRAPEMQESGEQAAAS